MVINKTCSTCGNMKKEGYKLFCHGWGDPFPDEVQPNGTCGGAWKPR
jgi:flavodoxin